jgi:digeranylgeranylglycerophospholipid reductase
VRSTFCNDNTLHFFIGASVIEKGYAWVFPKSASEISVGAGVYRGNCEREKIAATLHRFLDTRMPGAQRSHFISGCIPLSICPRVPGKGRVLCIGDAARQVNPLTAGGIMNALEAADLVVQAIARHGLSRPDAVLRNYAGAWTRSQRRQQKLFYLLKEVFLESSDSALLKLLRRIPRSAGRVDRSKPFTFPLVPLARLALMWMPGFVRHAGVLFR